MTKEKLGRILLSPIIDRIIAISIGGYWLYQSLHWTLENRKGWPLMVLILNSLIKNLLTIFRRKPEKISLTLSHWLIALLACNWWLLLGALANQGRALISQDITSTISTVGLILILAAKLSLWRSFGVIPAKRKLQTTGLYRFVRHPMYGIEFLTQVGFILASFSLTNLLLVLGSVAANIGQALAEEDFFKDDEEYQAYKAQVTKRFIPFIV